MGIGTEKKGLTGTNGVENQHNKDLLKTIAEISQKSAGRPVAMARVGSKESVEDCRERERSQSALTPVNGARHFRTFISGDLCRSTPGGGNVDACVGGIT